MPTITFVCDACKKEAKCDAASHTPLTCLACGKSWAYEAPQTFFESCPVCQCTQFYKQKDFNRAFGCLIMLVGIALVPVTYGLSLPVFFFADWLLQRKVSDMGICYRCGAEFRGFMFPAHLKEFLHHIGEKYERKASEAKGK